MLGKRLGNWQVVKELGRGGMGQVYLVEATGAGAEPRLAAAKVLSPELAQDVGFRERFQREVETLRTLDHPAIVRFYESGVADGLHFFIMEYVDGPNCEQILAGRKRLPWDEVLAMAIEIASALKHAHDHGIIHRDLKPANLLQNSEGRIKLSDFGIARVFSVDRLTLTGGVIGSAEYISPEQAQGKPATPRSDFYSLGAVLYHLLTGQAPFRGKTMMELLHKHVYNRFDPPRSLVPQIPHELDEVVCVLMDKDPSQRPRDARMLLKLFEAVQRRLEGQSSLTAAPGRSRETRAEQRQRTDDPEAARVMSRLMRQELERQKLGGPINRFINQPVVLVLLLVLCVAGIVYVFWPASAEQLYQRGAALMESENPDDWHRAWDEYFEPLNERYPEHAHAAEVKAFKARLDEATARRQALREAQLQKPVSEAHWFYLEGLRLRQRGETAAARKVWEDLVRVFSKAASETKWVQLAQAELTQPTVPTLQPAERWEGVRASLERARQLRAEGKAPEAQRIWESLERMYTDDPSAQAILDEIRRDRAGQNP